VTLRTRLTAAFLAVVLGPVVVSAIAVASTVASLSESRESERLATAASTVTTGITGFCQRARAAAEALAASMDGVAPSPSKPAALVARGLADAARLEDGAGRVLASAGSLPHQPGRVPWGDCGSRIPAAAPIIAAVVELRGPGGELIGRARAAFSMDTELAGKLGATAGVDITVLDGDQPAVSTERGRAAANVALAAATGDGHAVRVQLLEPSAGQPLRVALSTGRADLAGLYVVLLTVVAVLAALAVLVARYLARTLTRPLADVAQAAELVASGDLDARVPVRGRDEVGRLATTFNRMTRDLKAYVSALTASRDQLRGNLALLGDTLSSTHDLDRILEVILETVMAATGARAGVVLLAERSAREWPGVLIGQCGYGLAVRGADLRIPIGEGLLGGVAERGEPQLGRVPDGGRELSSAEPTCQTYIAVPFSGSGQILGVLALYDRLGADDFDDGDLVTLRTFAGQAAVAVENVLLHRDAQRLSLADPVTGLWNRRYLAVSLRREVERASRFGRPLAVLALDLDRFRELDDGRGQQAGDAVLAEIAGLVLGVLREVDLVFRRGGERFVVLLPETGARGASRAAERICAALRDEPVRLGAVLVHCTASIGVAVYPDHAETSDALLDRADQALGAAKTAGGDTWRITGEPGETGTTGEAPVSVRSSG
jgi:diguanylate cyclase (GGDEF)-like protein